VLDRGRDTFGTTPLDAEADEILRMPEDTLWPFALSLALLAIAYALVASQWWLAAVGAVALLATIVGWLWPTPEIPHGA
jgi:hypothetical protein